MKPIIRNRIVTMEEDRNTRSTNGWPGILYRTVLPIRDAVCNSPELKHQSLYPSVCGVFCVRYPVWILKLNYSRRDSQNLRQRETRSEFGGWDTKYMTSIRVNCQILEQYINMGQSFTYRTDLNKKIANIFKS